MPLKGKQFQRPLCYGASFFALLVFVTPAQGQESGGATLLDTLTIIGTRTELSVQENPRSVSVVDQQQLQRQAPSSIGEALQDVPGIALVDDTVPGMKRLQIRGESSRRVTILVDGQAITDHSTYGTPLLINPAAVERIDVIRGPASVLYGGKAIGGVVNIITKRGVPDKAVELEFGGTYYSGSDGLQGWASARGTVENFDYRISGGAAAFDDLRVPAGRFTTNGRLTTTANENDDISGHIGFTAGDAGNHYFSIKAEQYRLDSEAWPDPGVITGNPATNTSGLTSFALDLPERDRRKVGVFYDGTDLTETLVKLHVDAYYQTIDRLFENNLSTFVAPVIPGPPFPLNVTARATSDDTITNYGGLIQADLELLENHYTIFGVQYLADVLETSKTSSSVTTGPPGPPATRFTPSFTEARIDTISVFAQDRWDITPDLSLTAGIRYNNIRSELETALSTAPTVTPGSRTQDQISWSAGLTYTGIQDTTLRALYSNGYISPTLLQSYGRTSAGGQTVFGNPNLELETANNFELGARYDGNGLILDLAAFYMISKDYINFVPCGTSGPACPAGAVLVGNPDNIYVNIDEAVTYGVEALAQYTIPGTQITPYVTGSWMQRRFDFAQFTTYNTNVPALAGRFGVRYEWDMHGLAMWADLFGRASTEVTETVPAPGLSSRVDGWATLNVAIGGTYGPDEHLRFVVEVDNITDEEYRPLTDSLPGVGRSVKLTAAVKF